MTKKVTNPIHQKALQLNKGYDWNPIPNKFRKKDYTPNQTGFAEIEIGEPDPVKSFLQWDREYWKQKNKK